ncbi:MAG: NAD+ synthase [Candidatus Margulisiibacteriota bacterium]
MNIFLAQLNPTMGAIAANTETILTWFKQAAEQKADLVVFPELSITGYSPKDLLDEPAFMKHVQEAIESLQAASTAYPETGLLVGAPTPHTLALPKQRFNSAILIHNGTAQYSHKVLLPNYDVFEEARYFDSATPGTPILFKNKLLGITICEDAWDLTGFSPVSYAYHPLKQMADQGADILINIAASPFQMGKFSIKQTLFLNHAIALKKPIVYVNQVGGNDDLIFDGGSFVLDGHQNCIAHAPFFKEVMVPVALTIPQKPGWIIPDTMDALHRALVLGVKDYFRKTGFSQAVIGLSGGIDSSVAATLAVDALGPENVFGLAMPSPFSSEASLTDAKTLAANLGISCDVVPIGSIFEAYLATSVFPKNEVTLAVENVQARIRGNLIMATANAKKALAITTGNKSELSMGYCTLYGDMSGAINPIADVFKTQVYELARHLNATQERIPESAITKAPSAELRPNQTDQDSLPPYPELDAILSQLIEHQASPDDVIRLGFNAETVRWIAKVFTQNEYKRQQAAIGLKVSSKAFGSGRRVPVARG